ncbi:hemerythrin domain-containing protein [Streptomyces sp. NPDC006617]|uniref:hemerythrin domain-containing protein n=1 Tax=Streptomyces sp. NPDC006617 TaxID=3155354 RepID=UPI0033A7A73F
MGHGGNVIDELTTDHREVEELFGRIEALPPGHKDRKLYADQATIELIRHSVAEEAYLYPAVREHVAGGGALADKELEDHAQAEQIMKDLESRAADDVEFDRLIGMLMSEIREHVADKVRRAKKTAPTRPHPSAPDKPPMNKLLAPGAGMVDRARDALSGRGKPG